MMRFQDFVYQRPNIQELERTFDGLFSKFEAAESFEVQDQVMEEINALRSEYESICEIAQIRYTIDTTDPF